MPREIAAYLRGFSFRRPRDLGAPFEAVGDRVPELLGSSAEDLCCARARELTRLPNSYWEHLSVEMSRVGPEGAPYCYTYRILLGAGHERWISERGFPVRSDSGELVAFEGFLTDVSDSVAAGLEVHEQRDRLRHALAAAPVVLFALDREGYFSFGEGRGIEMLGFDPSALTRASLADTFADLPVIVEAAERALRGEEFSYVANVGPLAFETRYAPLRNLEGALDGAVGVAVDVTERERALRDLRASEERFRALTENVTDVVIELDSEGCLLYASPSFRDCLAAEPSGLCGRLFEDLMCPEDRESFRSILEHACAVMEGAVGATFRLRRSDGSWLWAEFAGRAFRTGSGELRFVGVCRDVGEHRELVEALARQVESERRVGELSNRLLALESDALEGGIVDALGEAAALAGADRSYLVSFGSDSSGTAGTRELRPLQQFEWCGDGILRTAMQPHGWLTERVLSDKTIHVPDPAMLPPEANAERGDLDDRGVESFLGIPIQPGQSCVGLLGFECCHRERRWTEQEITLLRLVGQLFGSALRRMRAGEELRESRDQLIHSQKMEAVGRLAGGIAHDFNNLLTVILGFGRPLLKELDPGDDIREDIREICDSAERAAALTRQLLAFSRRQPASAQVVDLADLVRGVEPMLARLMGKNVELVIDLAPHLDPVYCDPPHLEQVLVNLVVNARDAMPAGGVIRIRTVSEQLGPSQARSLGLDRPGCYCVLQVIDGGDGMDENTRERIFDPFFTTKEQGKGTGLGLSIVYSVARDCGGAVAVSGETGAGTTFSVYIPPYRDEQLSGEHDDGSESERDVHTLLLVEDEAGVRRLLSRMLKRGGYRVLEAQDGREAIETATQFEGAIQLLVTDMVMPGITGGDLARCLCESRPELDVLFLSGYPEDAELRDSASIRPGRFLQKPFTHDELLDRVRKILTSDDLAGNSG